MPTRSIDTILSAAVVTGGTFTVSYPAGTTRGNFVKGKRHKLLVNNALFLCPRDFTVSLGATTATITYNGTTTLPAGAEATVELDIGTSEQLDLPNGIVSGGGLYYIDLGSPATADADGVCASQSVSSGVAALINGALATNSVAIFDVPRNVVAAWTTTAICTVTGTDINGNVLVENSASGTSMAGVKAFKTVTRVTFNANVTGATVGTGDVLGLPVYLPATTQVLRELQDNALATSGTLVAGLAVTTKSTATTADVRGTYDPNAACDGSRAFGLWAALEDPTFQGNPQFAG